MKILAAKYIAGQADEKEAALVKQWIKMSKRNEDCYIQLYETWHDILNAEPGLIDQERAWQLFLEKAGEDKKVYRLMPRWSKIAAAAAIVILISTAGYFYFRPAKKVQPLSEINVSPGRTQKIVLADGTTIWINAGSQFRYDPDFGETSRTVYLDGEAYFDIAKSDRNIPFIIKTKNFTIRDIGTIFNIKAYANEPLEATVIEGKISVEGKLSSHDVEESKVFLEKKQVLKINSQPEGNADRIKVSTIDSSQLLLYNGWKDNFLVFDEISFKELAKIIERRYDVEIMIADKELEAYKFTGSFRNVQTITKVMDIIRATTPVSYEVNGRVVTISSDHNNQ